MKQCEMLTRKKAETVLYKGAMEAVVCDIPKGQCPYHQDTNTGKCMDGNTRVICASDGIVEKIGLIKSPLAMKILTDKIDII